MSMCTNLNTLVIRHMSLNGVITESFLSILDTTVHYTYTVLLDYAYLTDAYLFKQDQLSISFCKLLTSVTLPGDIILSYYI